MPTRTRTRIATQLIENGVLTLSLYGEADESGTQHITDTIAYNLHDLCPDTALTSVCLNLMARGFGREWEGRYNRANLDSPDVRAIGSALWAECVDGKWTPGRVKDSEAEPTDLQLALAEVFGTPVHLIQQQFEEYMQGRTADGRIVPSHFEGATLIKTKANKTLRYFNKATCDQLAKEPRVAAVLAKLERERAQKRIADAKRAPAQSLATSLFGQAAPENAAAN